MTPIIEKAIAKKPDMIVGGTPVARRLRAGQGARAGQVQPEVPLLRERCQLADRVPAQGRARRTSNGIFSCASWAPQAKTFGNKTFVKTYLKKYGGNQFGIDGNSAEAWAVGQMLAGRRAAKTGSIDNAKIIKTLHKGTWPTVVGNLSWNAYGSPNGSRLARRVDQAASCCSSPAVRRAAQADPSEAALGHVRTMTERRP